MDSLRFYHVSPHRFEVGTLLVPSGGDMARTTFPESNPNWVYLNTSPYPHISMRPYPVWKNWHIYQAQPLEGLCVSPSLREVLCRSARVEAYLGQVNGLAPNPSLFEGVYACLSDEELSALAKPR